MYLDIDKDGCVLVAASMDVNGHCVPYEVPNDFVEKGIENWRYIDGEFVYTEPTEAMDPSDELKAENAELRSQVEMLEECIMEMASIVYA